MVKAYGKNRNLLSSSSIVFNEISSQTSKSPGPNDKNSLDKKQSILEEQLAMLEKQHNQILEQAENDKQRILENAKKESLNIEKTAYNEGYSQGLKNGYEDGYKKAIEESTKECEGKIQEATNILLSSKKLISDLADSNKDEIIKLSIAIAEQVLLKELKNKEALDFIFKNIVSELEEKKALVVKVNPIHKESIENQIKNLKEECSLIDDIHVLAISSIKEGDAVIESSEGTISIGYSTVIENIKAELL